MKKLLSTALACLTAAALFTGCGDYNPSAQDAKIGMIAGLNLNEQKFYNAVRKNNAEMADYYFVPFDNLRSMQMSLSSGDIEEMSIYKSVADYLIARRAELEISDKHKMPFKVSDRFCCAVKSEDKELLNAINGAIKSMKDDGTLDALTKKYIVELKNNEEPEAVEMPMIEGAETLKVAVTGDMPPLDLIRADGTPAGFNTAVLTEIGKRVNKNIELVSVESAARASALSSGEVDIIFWVRVPETADMFPFDMDCPDEIEPSDFYYKDETVHVGRR